MGQRAAGVRGVKTRCACTGSKPPWLNGLQRSRRQAASTSPRSMPNSEIAWIGVLRAARLVLAARRQQRGDHTAVDDDRRDGDPARERHAPLPATPCRRARRSPPARRRGPRARRARARPAGRRSRRRRPAAAARPPRGTPRAAGASRGCGRPRRRPCATRTRRGAALVVRVALTRERVQHEVPAPVGAALAVDALELGAARQAAALRPPGSSGAGRHVLHGDGAQTVRRLRPLARRRLMSTRPAFVCIRARKPWLAPACASWAGRSASWRSTG